MNKKIKVEILTNATAEVLQMIERFNPKGIAIRYTGLSGCDAPFTEISMFIHSSSLRKLIKELETINETNYFTGISNYPSIRQYL